MNRKREGGFVIIKKSVDTPEFQHMLGTIIILLAPIAPHFSSELWAGLRTVPVKHYQVHP